MFCFHNFFKSELILVKCPRQMAGEAAAFCDPAWKVSDVTALSAVTQTHWVPPRVIRVCRASSDTAGHLPGPPQERLLRSHVAAWPGPRRRRAGPGLESQQPPGRSRQGRFTVLAVALLSLCAPRLCRNHGLPGCPSSGVSFLGDTAGSRIRPSIDSWDRRAGQVLCTEGWLGPPWCCLLRSLSSQQSCPLLSH